MNEIEMYHELLDSGYSEKQIKKFLSGELSKEAFEKLIEAKEEQTSVDKKGKVKFKNVNHQRRAEKLGRLSDGNMTTYMNIALRYFENRCALSGERFESFGNGKLENSAAKNNLSAEHVVALCQGGDDIFPNLVPTVLQYNISKNGYYLLDWWTKQKDIEGKDLYSPYRLLKLINYMMKSIDARNKELNIKQYEKALLTPNEIDIFLEKIQLQDQSEQDNNKRKILSNTVTAAEEIDGKKFLTKISGIEGNIPKQNEQQIEITDNTHMMDIFLSDAIDALKKDKVFSKDNEFEILINTLESMYKRVEGKIPFEVETRNLVLEKLSEFGVEDNIYTVANEIFNTNELFKIFNTDKEHIEENLSKYFKEKENELALTLELSNAKTKEVIKNMPEILYNKDAINCIILYKKYISENIDYKVANKTYLQNLLNIKDWMVKNNTTKTPRRYNSNSAEETKLAIQLDTIRQALIKPYIELNNPKQKENYIKEHPEIEIVMQIVDDIDKNDIKLKEDSQYYWHILAIKEWMEKNNTTKPPRASNGNPDISDEEGDLGKKLSAIRQQLLKPYLILKTDEERESYKEQFPALEDVLTIVEWIDKNNIKLKEDSSHYKNAIKIKNWMEKNNTTKPPNTNSQSKTEIKLANALKRIRTNLINPYISLEDDKDKENYIIEHPELEDVLRIIEWIDTNNIKTKEDSQYYWSILAIKDWMEKNNTTRPPRILTNDVPEEEGKLGNKLSNIRRYLINPYTKLKTDEEKEEYKRKYPELEVVMEIVDKIDRDNISTSLRYMLEIKKWMEDNHTTRPPRSFNNTVPEEEGKLGYELSRIRNQLIRPYFDLQTEEEREEYKIINPDLETIMAIVNEIDKNNILVKEEQPLYIKIQEIQKWMEDNQTTKPPRCQNSTKSIPNEESILGDNLSYIRTHLIKPYKELQTEEEKNEFKMQHPELDDVMKIVDEIDRNNIKLKEDSSFYRNALKIKKWMEDNQTTKPPSRTQKDSRIISEEEDKLAQALANIRYYLIKPYSELNSEEDKENFKIDHPELEDVRDIIEEIDRNNVKLKEESSFYINALKIKKWMEDNQTTKLPRSQYKSRKTGENAVPIEEARLGDRLSDIKLLLISPYKKLENDEDKKDFKKEHPEIEDVLKIVEWMESHIPEKLRQAQEILEWMKKNNTTKTPRATIKINNKALKSEEMNEVQKEEYTLGNALRRIRSKLINPYLKLQTNEEREKYKQINPEIEDVLQLIEEIDTINKKVPKSVLIQKTVIEQREHGLLGENFETENEFDKTVKSVEYKLKSSEIDK